MNIEFLPFDSVHLSGYTATRPLARPVVHLPLYPQGVGRIRKAAKAATTPLSRLVSGPGLLPRCFTLKDSDPLRAKARVESYAAATHPDAPSDTSNCGF
jgi:hypothetical protein